MPREKQVQNGPNAVNSHYLKAKMHGAREKDFRYFVIFPLFREKSGSIRKGWLRRAGSVAKFENILITFLTAAIASARLSAHLWQDR